ncbi:MFS transporter [Streptomyces sp. NPDC002133]|uniref:MFS transporter n=1 Tax=Streptomyces sp. NPDC002133 TaxID=3154409 RepID=UPI003328C319
MTPSPHALPFRTVLPVLALCRLAVFFDGMDVNIHGAVMPHMLDETGLGPTPSSAGTIGSWTTFGMLIGALTAGNMTDWLGRRPLLVASVTLFSLGSALCAGTSEIAAAPSSPARAKAVKPQPSLPFAARTPPSQGPTTAPVRPTPVTRPGPAARSLLRQTVFVAAYTITCALKSRMPVTATTTTYVMPSGRCAGSCQPGSGRPV